MDVELTEGAILKITTTEHDEEDYHPTLQVLDLKQIRGGGVQENERYRLNLSDGSAILQGMLSTQLNFLVHQGLLQKSSVLKLTRFTCTTVQNRKIIVIVSLDVLYEKCDIIGQPMNARSPAIVPGNAQSLNSSARGAGHEAVTEAATEQSRVSQSYVGAYSSGVDSGRYATMSTVPNHPRPESGSGFVGSAPVSGSYGGQNTGLHSPGSQVLPPVRNSYGHAPQLPYQQPPPSYQQSPSSSYAHSPQSTYRQPPPSPNARPPPSYNRGQVAKNEVSGRIGQICGLTPYQNRWTIKGRVTTKSELRSYTNARGAGKVFNFDIIDSGGEIRVTCFNDVAAEIYNLIEEGKLYLISKGKIKPAVRKFNHLDNDYEVQLDTSSVIQQSFEDDGSIPQMRFNFRPISDVEGLENNITVDIIGVVSFITSAASMITKNGETQKRTLQLKDMSGRSVEVTLWGNLCNVEGQELQSMCDSGLFPVLAVKAGRVHVFNGKGLSTTAASRLFIEPKISQADEVRAWFDREGRNTPCVSISRQPARTDIRKTISQIKDEKLGTSEKPDWITVSATIIFLKTDNYIYQACPIMKGVRKCSKKVINDADGTWRCDSCGQSVQQCDYRYILNLQIQDHTGIASVTAFQETGEEIMDKTAKDFHGLSSEMQDEIIRRVLFTEFVFKLKVMEETYNDEQRVKSTIVKTNRVKFSSKARFHSDWMDKFRNGDTATPCAGMDNIGVGSSAIRQHTPAVNVGYSTNSTITSKEFGAQANPVGHVGSQYVSPRIPSTGTAGSYLSCNICGSTTHNSLNCPNFKQAPGQSSGEGYTNSRPVGSNSGDCYKCEQPGHWAKDCPGSNHMLAYGNSGVQPGRYGVADQRVSY